MSEEIFVISAASGTPEKLSSDPKHLGAKIGYTYILYTWGTEMNLYPHIHTIVLGGCLEPGNHWKDKGNKFFLPIQVFNGAQTVIKYLGKNTHRIAISNQIPKNIERECSLWYHVNGE